MKEEAFKRGFIKAAQEAGLSDEAIARLIGPLALGVIGAGLGTGIGTVEHLLTKNNKNRNPHYIRNGALRGAGIMGGIGAVKSLREWYQDN
jgi:hypothetical protein